MSSRKSGEWTYGQEYDPRTGIVRPYRQQMQNIQENRKVVAFGDPSADITVNDANSAVVKEFDLDAIGANLLALPAFIFETSISMQLPDELISVIVSYNKNKGIGGAIESGEGSTSGTTYGASLSTTGRGSSSLAIAAEAQPRILQIDAVDLPCTGVRFYTSTQVTSASIIAHLAALTPPIVATAWPIFHKEQHSITTFSNQVNLSTNASAQQSVNASGSGTSVTHSEGSGVDNQVGGTVRTTFIPPTLHRDIYIGNTSESDTITCSSSAGWTGTTSFPSRSASSSVAPQTVTASVSPTLLAATTPSRVPRSGNYLMRPFQVDLLEGGTYEVSCKIFDASVLQAVVRDLEYSEPSGHYTNGQAIEPNVPTWNGGSPDSFSISPTFVSQTQTLVFNTTNGVISGSPTTAFPTTYTITATNALGSTHTTITFEVN